MGEQESRSLHICCQSSADMPEADPALPSFPRKTRTESKADPAQRGRSYRSIWHGVRRYTPAAHDRCRCQSFPSGCHRLRTPTTRPRAIFLKRSCSLKQGLRIDSLAPRIRGTPPPTASRSGDNYLPTAHRTSTPSPIQFDPKCFANQLFG